MNFKMLRFAFQFSNHPLKGNKVSRPNLQIKLSTLLSFVWPCNNVIMILPGNHDAWCFLSACFSAKQIVRNHLKGRTKADWGPLWSCWNCGVTENLGLNVYNLQKKSKRWELQLTFKHRTSDVFVTLATHWNTPEKFHSIYLLRLYLSGWRVM